jgi:hypothetical protein
VLLILPREPAAWRSQRGGTLSGADDCFDALCRTELDAALERDCLGIRIGQGALDKRNEFGSLPGACSGMFHIDFYDIGMPDTGMSKAVLSRNATQDDH